MRVQIAAHQEKKGFFTVTPYGDIDSDTHHSFREELNPVLEQSPKIILLDLSHVDAITSAGLGVLFSIKKQMVAHHGELLFCNLKPQIIKLFEIVKTLPREHVFTSIDEADAYFARAMTEEIKRQNQRKKS